MMERAREEASRSLCRMRVGAVVVKGGRIIAIAHNSDRNHPFILEEHQIRKHASICAERAALALVKNARGAVVYVARVRKDGSWGSSYPCERCQAVMAELGIKRVVYV